MKRIAIVSGSFKPPHKGHLYMVNKYSKTCDEVVVLISAPSKALRMTNDGQTIDPEIAKRIFNIYIREWELENVTIEVSPFPSPVLAAFERIKTLKDVEVVFGSSKKDGDWNTNWKNAQTFIKKNSIPISMVDPEESAVDVQMMTNGPVNSTIMRTGSYEQVKQCLPVLKPAARDEILTLLKGDE